MPRDAIVGATYYDGVFGQEFVIADVTPEEYDSHDPSEIDVVLEYDTVGEITVTLEEFRSQSNIEVRDVPDDE